ncbi:hypothetical protein VCHA57P527_110073 [Vibrio chagasii]|nr:hypothetical protein VCHA37O177_100164 [Vibrio chagasii]CAH7146717.1 hypothetical protein VCHA57P527_110073 [Vibrio chagasii]
MVELYPTRKVRVCKHNIAGAEPIDSRENQAVQASCCGMKYRISLAARQWTNYNVSDKKN